MNYVATSNQIKQLKDSLIDEPWNNPQWVKENIDKAIPSILSCLNEALYTKPVKRPIGGRDKESGRTFLGYFSFNKDAVGSSLNYFHQEDPKSSYYKFYVSIFYSMKFHDSCYLFNSKTQISPGCHDEARQAVEDGKMTNITGLPIDVFNHWFKTNVLK